MNDNASVTASSLAISEKRPRKTGGCVGIFFQLFDWNRRFAKKKLFSKRLLPPDRAKEASKKFGGDEKLPKLRLIADENSGGFPNTNKNVISTLGKNVQTPSLVARLMGLESMPSVQRNKLHKDSSNEFRRDNNNEYEKETTRQDSRPQKLQKTGMADRRSVSRFGSEALQLKNVLSRSRKHHNHHHHHPKLASPVKTTAQKRNTSRLIGAATRILEPGLQRNKSKFALPYAHSSRTEPIKFKNLEIPNQTSCKNCGNLLDISKSTSKRDAFSSFHQDQEQDFPTNSPSSNHFKNGVSSQSTTDVVNDTKDFVALNKSLTNRTRSRVPTSSINKPRMRPEYQGQSGKNSDNGMGFRFSSPMKNRCEVPTRVEKRRPISRKKCLSSASDEKIVLQKVFPLTGESLGAVLQEKLNEITGRMECESGINGSIRKRTPTRIFQELMCALNMEKPENYMEVSPQRNHLSHDLSCGHDHNHNNMRFCLQTNSKKSGASVGYKNSNHLSPGSVLDASFSNESCCSSSLEDNSSDQFYSGISFNTTSSELVDTLTEIMWTKLGNFFGSRNSKTQYQVKRFVFDSLMEYLDSKHGQFPKSGFIIDEVVEEVMRWMDMIGLSEDEVAKRDMRDCLGKVTDFEGELSETCGRIEGELFKMLVDEIVVDLCTN